MPIEHQEDSRLASANIQSTVNTAKIADSSPSNFNSYRQDFKSKNLYIVTKNNVNQLSKMRNLGRERSNPQRIK